MLGGGTGHGVPSLWGREGDCGRPARREFGGADLEQGIALSGQGRVGKRRVGMRIAAPPRTGAPVPAGRPAGTRRAGEPPIPLGRGRVGSPNAIGRSG